MYRSHNCGELTLNNNGENVTLSGWVSNNRNFGGLAFIDLRDRYGITQVVCNPENKEIFSLIPQIKNEFVIKIEGKVNKRIEGQENKSMKTGEIEVIADKIEIISKCKVLPFSIVDEPNTSEENRFKYRYLDLRRNKVLENIKFKSKMTKFTRDWFTEKGFSEIQTPIFTVSSPEGARDYLIPSRVNKGQFYALPQAPQQYKQLLMVGGMDKYFQIAPCFRDEDPRADRHSCEFYQIDCEMSFVEKQDVYNVVETFMKSLFSNLVPNKKIVANFERLKFKEAIDLYGSDKPDLRFGMKFVDMTSDFINSEFVVFKNVAKTNGSIKAMKLEDKILSRKEVDGLTEIAKKGGAKGLAYITYTTEGPKSSIVKFLSDSELKNISDKLSPNVGDTLLFVADEYDIVVNSLGKVRLAIRDKYLKLDPNDIAFCWVEDFPMFELNSEKDEKLDFAHNPFSIIKGGKEALKNAKNPLDITTEQYDLACNGYEILSGSIRNHDSEVLLEVFKMVGKGEKEIKEKFGAMYEAFQYGPPPHGGFAIGFDRLMMILIDEENIRECYAFPKSGKAQDTMMGAPGFIDQYQLDELGIKIEKDDSEEE